MIKFCIFAYKSNENMDISGEWLYLLLIIGIAFSGAFKGKKKQNNTSINIPKDLESANKDIKIEPKNIKKINSTPKKETIFPSQTRNFSFSNQSKITDKIPQTTAKTSLTNNQEIGAELKPNIENYEELRRAFIFSEILKRKY